MALPKATDQVQDEVLDFVRKSQKTITDAGKRWTETLRDLVPEDGDRVRKVVDEAFDLTERILRNQRELANSVLNTVLREHEPERAVARKRRAVAPRATAKRASAKRATAAPRTKRAATTTPGRAVKRTSRTRTA